VTVDDNAKRINVLENRMAVIEDRVLSKNGLVTQSLCSARHKNQEMRMDKAERKIASMDLRLWGLLVIALATLLKVALG
jgi:hypothetical protein